jgi:acyl dehydratase
VTTTAPLLFDDLRVDQEWLSAGRTVNQADVHTFADLTGDRQPIHLDPEYAKASPFRRCIGHGLLGLSLASGLAAQAPPVGTIAFLGLREWHFRAPFYVGDTIRVRNRVLAKEPRSNGRRGAVTWRVEIINQDGLVVQDGVTVTLVQGRQALTRQRRVGALPAEAAA